MTQSGYNGLCSQRRTLNSMRDSHSHISGRLAGVDAGRRIFQALHEVVPLLEAQGQRMRRSRFGHTEVHHIFSSGGFDERLRAHYRHLATLLLRRVGRQHIDSRCLHEPRHGISMVQRLSCAPQIFALRHGHNHIQHPQVVPLIRRRRFYVSHHHCTAFQILTLGVCHSWCLIH